MITAECMHCAWIYRVEFTLNCPHCHNTGVRWVNNDPDPYGMIDQLREMADRALENRPELSEAGVTHSPKDLAVLEHLWNLTEYDPTK
jgi:hypothetical protein